MRNMMRFGMLAILLTALILPLLEAAAAQVAPPANVHLRVVDSQTGKDIPGALVRFTDAKGESPGFDQGVDKEGIVEIYLNDGRYQVTGMSSDDTYDKNLLLLDVHGNGSTLLDQAGQAFPDEEQGIIKLDPIGATVAAPDNQVDTYVYQNPDDPDNPEAFSTASELEAANQLVANHIIDSPSQAFCGLVRNVTLHDVLRSRRSGNAVIWVHYESFGPVTLYRCQPAPGFTFRGQDGRLLQEAYVERPCSNVIIPAGTVPPKPEVPVTPPPYVPEKTPTPEVPSTETPVPTVTPTQVVTPTETPETPTSTPTEEITPTPTEEVTATPTETPVCTECTPPSTPVPTPTESASPTPTEVFINTPTPTEEVTPTPTKPVCTECTPPSTPVPTPTESASPTPTEVFNTPTPEATATVPLSTATVVQPTTTPMPTATESGCVGCKTPEIPVATNTPYVGSTPTPVFSTATQVVPTATESGCLGCVDPITPVPTATQSANPTPTSVFGEESQVGQQSDLTNSSNNDDGEAMIENVVGGTVSFEMDATTTPEESGQVSNDSVADSTDGSINDTSQPEGVVSNDNQTSSEASIDGSDNSDTVDSQTTNDTDNTDIGDSDSNNQFVDVKTAGSSDGDETIVTDTSNGEDNDSGVIAFIESPDTGDDSGGDSEGNEGAVESSQTISNDTSNGDAGDLTVDDSGADVGTDTSSGGTTDAPPADSGADDSSAVASPALLGILLGVIALVILGWSLTKRVDRLEAASNTISINLAPPDSQRRTPLRRQSRKE